MAEQDVACHTIDADSIRDSEKLAKQDLATLDISSLTPSSAQVISRQATINCGTIGHVAHGKSTVVKSISGVKTVRFKSEVVRNITIKLGYANAKIYRCNSPTHTPPSCYTSRGSGHADQFPCDLEGCSGNYSLVRHVSFVDCFGPDAVFATPTGVIRNADIVPGTVLLGPDGQPRVVTGDVDDGAKPMFEVQFATKRVSGVVVEADKFTASGGHLLCLRIDAPVDAPVHDRVNERFSVKHFVATEESMSALKVTFATEEDALLYYNAADKKPIYFTMTIDSYLLAPSSVRRKARMYLPGAMEFGAPSVDLRIGSASEAEVAWLLGVWSGNGDAVQPHFTQSWREDSENALRSVPEDNENVKRIQSIASKMDMACTVQRCEDRNAVSIGLAAESGLRRRQTLLENPFWQLVEKLGMAGSKHVPAAILSHTQDVRAAFAAGMIDADGGSYSKGQFELEQSEKQHSQLFHGCVRLLRTLGFVAHCSRRVVTVDGIEQSKLRVRFNGASSLLPIASPSKQATDLQCAWASSVPFTVAPIGVAPFRKWRVDRDGLVLLESFVVGHNCPGHDILMATMLNGAAVMDAAMLLVAANERCPQPQTSEHLAAIEIMGLQHILILQNKIDLVREASAKEQYNQIQAFVEGTNAEGAPVVPISAQLKYNIDVVCELLCTKIPMPMRNFMAPPHLILIRSFDINKPGTSYDRLQGGVAGGTISKGVLKVGDLIEIRPGRLLKDASGRPRCVPIITTAVSLFAESNPLQYAVPGGLIGIGTKMDPQLCRGDRLVGNVLGHVGHLPPIFSELEINFFLLRRLLGVKTADDGKLSKVTRLTTDETLMVNVGSTSTGGRITAVHKDLAKITLFHPVCTSVGERVALSRRVEKHWRLIGWGKILRGDEVVVVAAVETPTGETGLAEPDSDGESGSGSGSDGEGGSQD